MSGGKPHRKLCNECLSKGVKSPPLGRITGLFGGKKEVQSSQTF